jgi:hypothetical protein
MAAVRCFETLFPTHDPTRCVIIARHKILIKNITYQLRFVLSISHCKAGSVFRALVNEGCVPNLSLLYRVWLNYTGPIVLQYQKWSLI